MIEAVVPLCVAALAFLGVKKRVDSYYLSNEQGKVIKGVFALLLVIIHIRQRLEVMPVSYRLLASGGFLLVSVFFFYSGFGIAKKTMNEADYIKNRLPIRIIYLAGLIVVSEIVYYFFSICYFKNSFLLKDMFYSFLGIKMLNGACWTIVAMIIIQLIFYILYRCGSDRLTWNAIAGCVIYVAFSIARGRGVWEMQSCGAFVLGVAFAENEDALSELFKNKIKFIISILLFVIAFSTPYIWEYYSAQDYIWVRILFGTVASCSFVLILFFVLYRIKLSNHTIVLIGNVSTEIYLWHGLIIDVVKKECPDCFGRNGNYICISALILCLVLFIAVIIRKIRIVVCSTFIKTLGRIHRY